MELGCTHEEAGLSRGAPYAEKVGSRITDRMQAAEVVTIRYNCNTVAPESNRRLPPISARLLTLTVPRMVSGGWHQGGGGPHPSSP